MSKWSENKVIESDDGSESYNAVDFPCGAFAKCENTATQFIPHPILMFYPACDRCADKMERIENG